LYSIFQPSQRLGTSPPFVPTDFFLSELCEGFPFQLTLTHSHFPDESAGGFGSLSVVPRLLPWYFYGYVPTRWVWLPLFFLISCFCRKTFAFIPLSPGIPAFANLLDPTFFEGGSPLPPSSSAALCQF